MGAWGVKGGLKIKPFSSDPQALFSSKRWYLQPGESQAPAAARATGAATAFPAMLKVLQAREHGDGVVATVHDIEDRDSAQALIGARIFVSRGSFPTPDDGEFYWIDLIGMQVVDRQGQMLGMVDGLIETGPHCVLRISAVQADAPEVLIPFVVAYVDAVDLTARRISVDWGADY